MKTFSETIREEIKNQAPLTQRNTLEAIEAQFIISRTDTTKQLEMSHETIQTNIAAFTAELKGLQEQIKLTIDALDPDIELDSEKTENADAATTATRMVRKVTTQIERIAASQQKMSINYYNSANEQARQGFKLAWMFGIMGAILLGFTIVSAVVMTSLHLYGFSVLLGAVGGIGTTIVTFMGGLSSLQARTAKQFASAHMLLDRSYRPTIAHAMCIGYTDDERKQAAIDKIIDGLLKNDAPIKDVS